MYETYRGMKGESDVIQNLAWWFDDMDSIHCPELLLSVCQTVFCLQYNQQTIWLSLPTLFSLKPHSNKNVNDEVQKHQPSQQKEIVSKIMIFTIDMIFIWIPLMTLIGCSCDCVHNSNKTCPDKTSQTCREQIHAHNKTLK